VDSFHSGLGDWLLKTSAATQNQALAAEMMEEQTRQVTQLLPFMKSSPVRE